ncbi:MAG TPA: metallophosphoesterase [Armatimonadota bacterium]|jgi:predicted phosphodiesterase
MIRLRSLMPAFLFALAACRCGAATVVKGPYLLWVTDHTAIVMWETTAPTAARVTFTPPTGAAQTVDVLATATVEQARIDTLTAGTRYTFTVDAGAQRLGDGAFLTDRREAYPITFAVVGDNQSYPDRFLNINRRLMKRNPEFVINTGDITGDGNNFSLWSTEFFTPSKDVLRFAPCYVSIGNHEANSPDFRRFLPYPETVTATPVESRGHYYSFLRGNMAFLVCDAEWDMSPGSAQYQWMESTLSSAAFQQATWRVAYCHQPAYSVGWEGYDGTPAVRNYAFPMFQKYGVSMFFSGHTHDYERTIIGDIVHVINGGAAGGNENWGRNWLQSVRYANIFFYLIVKVNGDKLEVSCYDNGDRLVDRYSIQKGKSLTLPGAPQIVRGPKTGARGRQYITLKYPAGGTGRYRYRVAVEERKSEDGFWEATPVMYPADQEVTVPVDVNGAGTYHIIAQALDAQYWPSAWTESAAFSVQ